MDEALQFLTQHGALILFAVVFAEQVGLPIPSLPFLIAAGALVAGDQMGLGAAVGSAVLATLLGDQVWFELGRWRGRRLLNWLSRISRDLTSGIQWTEEFFSRHGIRSLIIAKFVPGLSTVAPAFAGIVGFSVPLFLWYDALGTLLWVASGLGVGYAFGGEIEQLRPLTMHLGPTIGIAAVGMVVTYIGYKALQRYRGNRTAPCGKYLAR